MKKMEFLLKDITIEDKLNDVNNSFENLIIFGKKISSFKDAFKSAGNKFKKFETIKYGIANSILDFKKFPEQRNVVTKNLLDVLKLIIENGLIPYDIIVNEKMEITHHQHLAIVLHLLGEKIPYKMVKGLGEKQLYSEFSKKIGAIDILSKHLDIPQCKQINDILLKFNELSKGGKKSRFFKVTIPQIVAALTGEIKYDSGLRGSDKVYNTLVNVLTEFSDDDVVMAYKYLTSISFTKRHYNIGEYKKLHNAFLTLVRNNDSYDSARFQKNLPDSGVILKCDISMEEQMKQICTIHNMGLSSTSKQIIKIK